VARDGWIIDGTLNVFPSVYLEHDYVSPCQCASMNPCPHRIFDVRVILEDIYGRSRVHGGSGVQKVLTGASSALVQGVCILL
jgi:hypothetical protein